jgi:diacylglycerol O-acyltransferase / wax synthase
VMFVLVSYKGTCGIGVTVDEAAIPDTRLFQRCLVAGFDEVLRLGEPAKNVRPSGRRLIRS